MIQNNLDPQDWRKNPRAWSGAVLVISGGLLLAYKLGAAIPGWIFSWPMLLIIIGFLSGIKNNFHNPGGFIMIIVGGVFLVDEIVPTVNFHNFIAPALLIGVGLSFILRPKRNLNDKKKWMDKKYWDDVATGKAVTTPENYYKIEEPYNANSGSEYVDIKTAFGAVKKNIISKNFQGGEIYNFMGGTELNLLQADMTHPVIMEVHNIFGGAKFIIPSNWDVKNDVTAVFGGIEDKRNPASAIANPDKVMILKGSCIFGGIEVTNY